eukprot:SAG31_NODE_2118_length_6410_cov_3.846142_5_plen_305_part_00
MPQCNLWDGGVRGTAFINSPLLQLSEGYTYFGLMHAVDIFPTLLLGAAGLTRDAGTKPLDGLDMWTALQHNGTSPRKYAYIGVSELYIGLHGPALRDASGWKLILNGGGGVGGWNMKPGSGGVPPTPQGATLGACGNMMDTYEGWCIDHDGFGQLSTNSTDECCTLCLTTRGCFSWVVDHQRQTCYINRNDIQIGTSMPPTWPRARGNCTYACISGQPPNGTSSATLFNLATDPSERHNLTTEEPSQLTRLVQVMAEHTKTAIPQCTELTCGDKRCPKPALHRSPTHGWYWSPWCVDEQGNDIE